MPACALYATQRHEHRVNGQSNNKFDENELYNLNGYKFN